MFSSNQIFEISGTLEQLEETLKFVFKFYGCNSNGVYYQIAKDGKFCLGWYETKNWKKFDLEVDTHIISEMIKVHLKKQERDESYDWADGSTGDGFLMKCIDETFSDEKDGIKEPFYGIISIEQFTTFYSK